MRVTVCELPHEPALLAEAWPRLCDHAAGARSELVLLPEFAFAEPVWMAPAFDAARWSEAVAQGEAALARLPELQVPFVVGARPVLEGGRPFNEGFLWTPAGGAQRLRRKYFLPDEPGGWEAKWFDRGDASFPAYSAGDLMFGLSICTELWALENCAGYAAAGVAAVLSPRATAAATTAKWRAVGTVTAVRSGAYSVSSNRVQADGSCGGVGWVIDPDGEALVLTSAEQPFATCAIHTVRATEARETYPRYVFEAASR